MTLDPVLPWWVLTLLALVFVAFSVSRIATADSRSVRLAWLGRLLMVILLIAVAARPALPGTATGPTAKGGLEVYFVVDTTSSMAAEDYAPGETREDGSPVTRLDGVKADIAAITESLPGAQYSLISFDASVVQRVPLTADVTALASAVSVLTQEVTAYSIGSSIDEPVDLLESVLGEASTKSPGQQRVLFYFGDGEQTSQEDPGTFGSLAPLISGGAVLGYGTDEGGRMLNFDGFNDELSTPMYIQDYSEVPPVDALSKIDEDNLAAIAADLELGYEHREPRASVDALVEGIDVGQTTVTGGTSSGPFEFYWIIAIPLGLLILLEIIRATVFVTEQRPPRPVRTDGGAR